MKKAVLIFVRVIFVLAVMLALILGGSYFYFQHQSEQAIQESLRVVDAPVIGEREGTFAVVEFFDYRCAHCQVMSRLLGDALDGDTQTKVILRPVVIGDPESLQIAALVLAADMQKPGATLQLHRQIMEMDDIPTYERVKIMAGALGIDVAAIESGKNTDIAKAIIGQNTQMVRDIGFYGVPALVIGDKGFMTQGVMPGINELRLMILDAKERLKITK